MCNFNFSVALVHVTTVVKVDSEILLSENVLFTKPIKSMII